MHRWERLKLRGGYFIKRPHTAGLAAVACLLVCVLLPACGYRISGQTTSLPGNVRTIAIPVFGNDSREPGVELAITKAVIRRFEKDGRLRIVDEPEADSVLKGRIENYELEPISFDSLNNVSEYRVRIKIHIIFEDTHDGGVHLEKTISNYWNYSLGESIIAAEVSRQKAINETAIYLGDDLLGLLLEGF